MSGCGHLASGDIELYFYGELDQRQHASIERHVRACGECRHALDDLATIRAALSTRPDTSGPADGDWTGFMARLDAGIQRDNLQRDHDRAERRRERVVTLPAASRLGPAFGYRAQMALAALLTLATIGAAYVFRNGAGPESRAAGGTAPASETRSAESMPIALPVAAPAGARTDQAAFTALSEQHFERSKLVVLGLANKDPRRATVSDWQYERELASSLLSDTRLYRLAAEERGLKTLAKVMGDLELVLLQTSTAERPASTDLEQIQRLITKRDLVTKMDAVTSAGL